MHTHTHTKDDEEKAMRQRVRDGENQIKINKHFLFRYVRVINKASSNVRVREN